MNAVDRQRVRVARDQHARATRALFLQTVGRKVCQSCADDLDQYTNGCNTCSDRRSKRRVR